MLERKKKIEDVNFKPKEKKLSFSLNWTLGIRLATKAEMQSKCHLSFPQMNMNVYIHGL